MADIDVTRTGETEEEYAFDVQVSEGGEQTRHVVTVQRSDLEGLGDRYSGPEELVRSSFEFLLERESKDSILHQFDLRDISTYFPEFDRVARRPGS